MTGGPYQTGAVVAGRYRIVGHVGSGGMGSVYEAEHVQLGRRVALKVLLATGDAGSDAAGRFQRGARNAAKIEHPNVCAVTDFGETADGRWFLAMEFIEGRSLGELLRDEGRLEPVRALAIGAGIARALSAAHELGIVHRDLKPDNVMLPADLDDDPARVKVVDFDIARAIQDESEQEITRAQQTIGTPEYMSPEQCMGQPLDARSDLYALGLLLYRMLSGELPFSGSNTQEVMTSRLVQAPRPLEEAMGGEPLPEGLADLVGALLAREREHRLSRAEVVAGVLEELRAALTAPVAAAAGSAAAPEPGHPSGQRVRAGPPRRLGWAVAGVVGCAGFAAAAAFWWMGGDANGSALGELESSVAVSGADPAPSAPGGQRALAPPNPDDSAPAARVAGADGPVTPPPVRDSGGQTTVPLAVTSVEDPGVVRIPEVPPPIEVPPRELDGLLAALARALQSGDDRRVRELYPDVQSRELDFWREAIASVGGGVQVEFRIQTPPELRDDGGEIRVMLLHLEGDAGARPFPVRARLNLGADGVWTMAELLRLDE